MKYLSPPRRVRVDLIWSWLIELTNWLALVAGWLAATTQLLYYSHCFHFFKLCNLTVCN